MKTLLILRHGKSSWKHNNLSDHDRPLKKRGKADAPKIGRLIRDCGLVPELILCSTAKRAKDTANIVADSCGFDGRIQFHRVLYHGYTSDYLDLLKNQGHDDDIVMVVGHNPGLEELLSDLTDVDEWLPTTALVQVELDIDKWDELDEFTRGELKNMWRPRELVN